MAGSTQVTLVGGEIPVAQSGGLDGQCVVDVEVTSTTAGSTGVARIEAGDLDGQDNGNPVSNISAAVQTITVLTLSPATLAKQFSATTVAVGNPFRMTVTVGNPNTTRSLELNGVGDTPAYGVEDVLPAGMEIAPTPNASTTCVGGSVDVSDSSRVRLVGGVVPAAGTCTFQVDLVTTTSGAGYSTSLNNTISGTTGFFNHRGLTANNASRSLTSTAMMRVSKSFSLGAIAHGQQSTLTITLTNASTSQTLELETAFQDSPLDQHGDGAYGLKVSGVPTTTCAGAVSTTAGNAGVELAAGTQFAPGASCTITVPFTATLQTPGTPQTFINSIAQGAVDLTDDSVMSQPATATVVVVDQLTVSKSIVPNNANVAPGNPVRFTVTVNNYAAAALTNVTITDALPAGMTLLQTPNAPADPSYSGAACSGVLGVDNSTPGTPVFTIPNMAAGTGAAPATCSVTFYAQTPPGAATGTVLANVIPPGGVTATSPGGPISNNGGSTSTDADFTIANVVTVNKGFSPATAAEGVVSQLTIQFTNLSAQPVTNASFTDNLPVGSTGGQLIVATPANASTTCVGGNVVATEGSNVVTMTGATLPARASNGFGAAGSCSLTVSVVGGAGNYTNSLPASALTGTETLADGTTRGVASPGPVNASLTYSSVLAATKSFAPATIASGGTTTVTVTLSNTSIDGTLNNVGVIDPLPAGMTVAATPHEQTTCAGGVVTATPGASTVSMTGALIPSGISCTVKFDVTASGPAGWNNIIPAGNITADGGVRNTTDVSAPLANSTTGDVTVTNAMSTPSLTSPGQVAVLTVTVVNSGAIGLTNVNLTDYFTVDGLPGGAASGLVVASTPNAQTTCTGGLVSASAGGTSLGLSGASIPAGASCTFSVNVTLTAVGTVQNTIPASALSSDQGISNALPSQTSLSVGSNLGVTKVFTPAVIRPNEVSRLRIQFINPSATQVTNLQVTDTMPGGVVIAPAPNPFTTCTGANVTATGGGNTVAVSGGSLAAASGGLSTTCYAEVDVTSGTNGAYTNTIPAGDLTGSAGGTPVNNPVPAEAILQVRAPLTLAKAFSPTTVDLGAPTTATLTITNPNAVPMTGATLRDDLPAGLTVALVPNASTTCGGAVNAQVSATYVTLTGATLPANGSCTVTFDAVSNVSGEYVNTIPAGNIGTNEGVTNELPATDTVRVTNRPTVNKQFNPASIPANLKSTLTIVLGNTNSTAATLSSPMVDTLPTSPAPIVVATPNALTSTCGGTAATAVAGSGVVTVPTGAIIPPGGCTITVEVTGTTEGTYTNTIPANALQTNFGANVLPTNADLSISPLGYISGKVFKDNNVTPNGLFDGTDAPLAGVTITLTGTDYGADGAPGGGDDVAVNRTVTTNALGNYAFTGLNPGAYTVTQPGQPAGTVNGITTAGTIDGLGTAGTASDPTPTSSAIGVITLQKDGLNRVGSSPGNNFAEVELSSIAGSVFLDQNDNGVRNAADTSLQGVTIELLNAANAVVATTTTGLDGSYKFSNLQPGTYTIREPTQPPGTANGKTLAGTVGNGGTPGVATAQNVPTSAIAGIVLPPGTASTGNDFAEVPAGRQISGRVFADANNDGVFNGGDSGLGGVQVVLTGTDFNGLPVGPITVTTDSEGRYSFTGLAEGTYTVTEPNQPAGTTNGITTPGDTGGVATAVGVAPSEITGIDLTGPATISANNNFGEILIPAPAVGAISGKVYVDRNDDGLVDADEPGVTGVVVRLTGKAADGSDVDLTTTTNAAGDYVFNGVPESGVGGYTITEVQPAAYVDGKTTAGSSGVAGSDKPVPAGEPDRITGVTLTAGGTSSGHNFGERAPGASIRGSVYFDADGNGARGPSELGIAGVTVRLTGKDATGATVDLTTVTDANGAYAFTGLAPSDAAGYVITEIQPDDGYVDGANTVSGPGASSSSKPVAPGGEDAISAVVLPAGGQFSGYDFGERRPGGTISGYVFADADNDGERAAGEAGIPGVTVRLTGVDANGQPVSMVQVTDANGAYAFTNVPASNGAGYVITEEQPSGYTDGKTRVQAGNPGSAASSKPVGVGDLDRITGVVFPGTGALTDYRFGEVPVPTLKPPIINGYVYLDRDHSRQRPRDGSMDGQPGWTVVLRQGDTVICTVTTGADGFYQFDNLRCPGYEQSGLPTGPDFSITFTKDGGSLPALPTSGDNRGQVPNTGGRIVNITLSPADQVVEQNLPLDPAGVVYDSATRRPVPGATVVISGPPGFDPARHLVGAAAAQTQVTGADGYYGFLLQNDFPSGVYVLTVTSPAGYLPGPSGQLPPCVNTLNVAAFPDPALIQSSDFAPGQGTPIHEPAACQGQLPGGSTTTQYYLSLNITRGGSAPILNNHIPLDPMLSGAILVTKTTPKLWVSRGELVPYTITATNPGAAPINNISVRDQLPPGFRYREGSAMRDGVPVTPIVNGNFVAWPAETFAPKEKKTYSLMLTVGAGVGDGDYVNRAWAGLDPAGTQISNLATAQVRIAPDPTLDCADIIGQVFDDRNANGYQDDGEPGIPGVRMATVNGLLITSDAEGRFHVPCPMTPDMDRGSNFVLKLDERSLPSGYRVTTENPRDVRLTRGKMTKLNFGATVHRVVRVELTGEAFEPGEAKLLPEWQAKIDAIQEPLRERPSIVRIAYGPGDDPPDLVRSRTRAVHDLIERAWKSQKRQYALVIEIEGEQ